MTEQRPPRLAEWILHRLRRSPDVAYLAGDLAEGFAARAAKDRRGARRWYWSQVMQLLRHRPESDAFATRAAGDRRTSVAATIFAASGAALRYTWRRPAPALVSALVVMLGVTATTTLAAVTWSVLYRPLPWPEPNQLVRMWETRGGQPTSASSLMYMSSSLDPWRANATTVSAIGTYTDSPITLVGPDGAERVQSARIALDLLPMLGAVPVEGRLLSADDERTAVVSEWLARRLFGTETALGRVLTLEATPHEIVGVLPDTFAFPSSETGIWTPYRWRTYTGAGGDGSSSFSQLRVIARLKPGRSPEEAAAEATRLARTAMPLDPVIEKMLFETPGEPTVVATPLLDLETSHVRAPLVILLAGVGLLMLTAVASVAGMQLARTADRRRELAIRAALGAGRRRLALQLLAEAVWVACLGGAGALLATGWILSVAPAILPADFPRIDAVRMDGIAVGALLLSTMVAGLLIGLLPALQSGRMRLTPAIVEDSLAPVGLGAGSAAGRARSLMIAGQMAVAVLLLVAAGLTGKTLLHLVSEDLGYEPNRVLMARLIGVGSERSARVSPDTLRQVTERLGALPGVSQVAVATALPFQSGSGRMVVGLQLPGPDGSLIPVSISENDVTPSYFELMGMRLVAGRLLNESDRGADDTAFVVNETFANSYLGENPIGPFPNGGRVVGIVADVRDRGADQPVDPQLFTLYREDQTRLLRPSTVYLQTSGDPIAVAPLAREVVRQVDGRLGLDSIETIDDRMAMMVARPRLYAWLVGIFAGFALLIASVGLFGVLAFAVSRRTREIGVRTALGATPGKLALSVVGQGMTLALAGTLAGLAAAAFLARYMTSMLYQVSPYDPLVFVVVPVTLLLVAALACYLPARRAARIDPLTALRSN